MFELAWIVSFPPCGLLAVVIGSNAGSKSEARNASSSRVTSAGFFSGGRSAYAVRNAPFLLRDQGGLFQLLKGKGGQKFLGRHLVVIAAVGPEKFGEFGDLRHRRRVDSLADAP